MRQLLVVISDSHSGHWLGLMSPDVHLVRFGEEGEQTIYSPVQTAFQEYLWYDIYVDALSKIAKISKVDAIVAIHTGDPTEGKHHGQDQLVTTSIAEQIQIAVESMVPMLALPNVRAFRFVMGTDTHEYGEGSGSVLVSRAIKDKYPRTNVGVVEHGLATIIGTGVTIDFSHHGPHPGSRSWLYGNVARYYLRDQMLIHMGELGQKPPDLFLRGHYHEYTHEHLMQISKGREYWSRLVVIPSMCGLGAYGRKATQSKFLLRNGVIAFVIENRRIVDHIPYVHAVDIRTKEQI